MITGVRFSAEMEKILVHFAELSKRSKSSILKEAFEDYIENKRDFYEALERLAEHEKSGEKTYTLEEVRDELGLDDDE